MNEKVTLRDYLTYTLIGFSFIGCFVLHYLKPTFLFLKEMDAYSGLIIFLLIPLCYLMGHFVLSIDDVIYNNCITRNIVETINMNKQCIFARLINRLLANRVRYVIDCKGIEYDKFEQQRMRLILKGVYEKADYYQIMSDLFKGVIIVILLSLFYSICKYSLFDLKTVIHFFLLYLFWYRSRSFTIYYINFIDKSSKYI